MTGVGWELGDCYEAKSSWGVLWFLWFFKMPQVSPLEKQRNRQHVIRCLIKYIWANRVANCQFRNHKEIFNPCNIGRSQFHLQNCLCSLNQFNCICCQFPRYCSSVLWFSFIQLCSVLFDLPLFFYSVFDYSIIQCYFLFWYWKCIPAISIPCKSIKTTIRQVNKHHTPDSTIFRLSIASESLSPS